MKLRILFPAVLFVLAAAGVVYGQNYIGIVIGGYEKECQVTRAGKNYPCSEKRQLFAGDVVHKKPSVKDVKVKWAPFAQGVVKSDTSMEAALKRPEKLKAGSYTAGLKEYINDFVKPTEHGTVSLVTRQKPRALFPARATLLREFPVKFGGENPKGSIVVTDDQGKRVFEKQAAGGGLSLSPAEAGLAAGRAYIVTSHGAGVKVKFDALLLEATAEEEIAKDLAGIDQESATNPEKAVKKAAYLQMVSDANPGEIDLYWLGHQVIGDVPNFSGEQEEAARGLEQRYYAHCRKKN